jgi:hypothetical protein
MLAGASRLSWFAHEPTTRLLEEELAKRGVKVRGPSGLPFEKHE